MAYDATVKLEEYAEDGTDVWRQEGRAEHVLLQAFRYLLDKSEGTKARNKFVQFLADDWQAFDKAMNKIFFRRD